MPGIARAITQWQQKEIEAVLKKSYSVFQGSGFNIRICLSHEKVSKILIVTPARIGSAPERNLFRRRLKALFYQEKIYTKGYHWVIFAKKDGLRLSFQELKKYMLAISRAL